jgi:HlyD family secretion protein
LTIEAPKPGVVIYETNWRNEKKQIGSDVFRTEKVLSLPDLTTLVIQGQVAEVDAGRLRLGQEVEVTVDALPDRIFHGKLASIGTIFRRASFDRPIKVLDVAVEFQDERLNVLRPGMVAKLEIIESRFNDVLAVPLSAIQVEGGQPFLWVRKAEKIEKRPVNLGKNNGIVGVVLDGLNEGEEFASQAPEVAS